MAATPSSEVTAEGTARVVAAAASAKPAADTDESMMAAATSSEVTAEATAQVVAAVPFCQAGCRY